MIRRLIGLVVVVVIALIGYNYYFGTAEEKENAKEIVGEFKKIGKASWDLLKSEKEKMEAGKYDEAADKFKDIFEKLKGIATDENNREYLDRLADLERKRQDLEQKLERMDRPSDYNTNLAPQSPDDQKAEVEKDLSDLYLETERLMEEMEKN
jgi:hypothetical protein